MRKKSIRRLTAPALALALFISALAGCGSTSGSAADSEAVSYAAADAEGTSGETSSAEVTAEAQSVPESAASGAGVQTMVPEVEPRAAEADSASSEAEDTESEETGETYFSELTGEPVSVKLQMRRPLAVMIDNSYAAWPHYEVAEGDVVYELMNSTQNEQITRLMVLRKDYDGIEQMGSIRSARPTNIILAGEWNAFLCHDGGPSYVNEYFAKDYAKQHFDGIFSRVENGKSREFTEYILAGDMDRIFDEYQYSRDYNEFRPERDSHFVFTDYGTELDLTGRADASECGSVALPFEHTASTLTWNAETETYDYSAYGTLHKDAEDGEVLTFKNVLIEECPIEVYDDRGYMIYDVIQSGKPGYYITDGHVIPITWTKESETGLTRYYDADGNELAVNRGKTYITLVPDDLWENIRFS